MSTEIYYVPEQSRWPILASIALFCLVIGASLTVNSFTYERDTIGPWFLVAGFLLIFYVLFGWFKDVIMEDSQGLYSSQMNRSFRQGMLWFIFSEVMFFAAFFGALFYVRTFAVPWLGGEGEKGAAIGYLWPDFEATWPLLNTPDMGQFKGPDNIINPWHLPLVNTILLISSSFTITFSHHALKENHRSRAEAWLAATILLGCVFLYFQAVEYLEAYQELGLTLEAGIYGATFFMLTGFHGFHVTLGTFILCVMLIRMFDGHFKPKAHFGFEAAAWYWHFVDVVWVGLFLFVYIL